MHIVFYFECIKHECIVQSHSFNHFPLLHHVHHNLLLFECEVLEHFLTLIDQLSRLYFLDGKLVEQRDLEHSKDYLESVGV